MDSSVDRQPNKALVSEEELQLLRTQRVSMRKACDLLGHSYPHVRRLVEQRRLIAIDVGARKEVTMFEIRRFLERGNATEKDWADHEGS